jgi:lambda family phage portal protein
MLVDQFGRPLAASQPQASKSRGRLNAKYDAAQDTEENRRHWAWADHDSAAAANSIEVRRRLRSRARYECHQANSFAKGICHTLANDTISTGPCLQLNTGDKDLDRWIEREWRAWSRSVNLAAKLRTARLSKVVDGEVFLLKSYNKRLRTPVQLDVRLIEADQISTPGFMDGIDGQVDGIEFDKYGYPINYHMLKSHPGDIWNLRAWDKDDIAPDDIIHMFRVERPGQVRGIPEITPALPLFAFLRRWTLATIAASETAANLAGVMETMATSFDDELGAEDLGEEPLTLPIMRNMMMSLPKGWKLNQFKPEQPTTTYEVFRNAILNEIARCVHMPANKALADSSKYNYSSGRLDHQTYYEAIDVERSQWELECLDRIFEWWLDEALMLSRYVPISPSAMLDIPVARYWRWNPPKHVDPIKEASAAVTMLDAGLKTEEQYLLEQNIDPEEHYNQLISQALRRRKLAELGGPMGNLLQPPSSLPSAAPGAVPRMATTSSDNAPAEVASEFDQPTGEFRDMSRRQMHNATKAIDDAIHHFAAGEWTRTRTALFLSSLGLKQKTIDALLDEIAEDLAEEDADNDDLDESDEYEEADA